MQGFDGKIASLATRHKIVYSYPYTDRTVSVANIFIISTYFFKNFYINPMHWLLLLMRSYYLIIIVSFSVLTFLRFCLKLL